MGLTASELQRVLVKLFSLELFCLPAVWNRGLIFPIFKSGDTFDPDKYQGVCVNSNLGKGCCCMLCAHLQAFLYIEHNVLSSKSVGFSPKHRTTDHLFTLHTIINKYTFQIKTKVKSLLVLKILEKHDGHFFFYVKCMI